MQAQPIEAKAVPLTKILTEALPVVLPGLTQAHVDFFTRFFEALAEVAMWTEASFPELNKTALSHLETLHPDPAWLSKFYEHSPGHQAQCDLKLDNPGIHDFDMRMVFIQGFHHSTQDSLCLPHPTVKDRVKCHAWRQVSLACLENLEAAFYETEMEEHLNLHISYRLARIIFLAEKMNQRFFRQLPDRLFESPREAYDCQQTNALALGALDIAVDGLNYPWQASSSPRLGSHSEVVGIPPLDLKGRSGVTEYVRWHEFTSSWDDLMGSIEGLKNALLERNRRQSSLPSTPENKGASRAASADLAKETFSLEGSIGRSHAKGASVHRIAVVTEDLATLCEIAERICEKILVNLEKIPGCDVENG